MIHDELTSEAEHLLNRARLGIQRSETHRPEVRVLGMVEAISGDLNSLDCESLRGLHELIDSLYYDPDGSRESIANVLGDRTSLARSDAA